MIDFIQGIDYVRTEIPSEIPPKRSLQIRFNRKESRRIDIWIQDEIGNRVAEAKELELGLHEASKAPIGFRALMLARDCP